MYDVIIIGAGVVGAAVARELSRFDGNFLVLEREEDVCCGTSKANSAIVHAGYDAPTGSLMAQLNVRGSAMMEQLSQDLDFPYRRNGSLVLCMSEEDLPRLQRLLQRGVDNGVEGLEILSGDAVRQMEPNVSDQAVAALYVPTGAIVCPFGLNIAMAENAAANGVSFQFDTAVTGFTPTAEGWTVHTSRGDFSTRCVVNAAGVHAGDLHNMVSSRKLHITPRRGDYYLLDKTTGGFVNHTIFQLPNRLGKGVLVTPTVHGNTLVGPTAIDQEDPDCTATTREGLDQVALSGDAVRQMEPNVSDQAVAALYVPTGAIVCPFGLNIAMAENAAANGVSFQFDTAVTGFTPTAEGWTVHTSRGDFSTRCVVNAAGVHAGDLHNMVSSRKLHITPRRGDYYLLDKTTGGFVNHTIFQLPNRLGKGVLVTPTVHGNTLVGPTAIDQEDPDCTATTREGLDQVAQKAAVTVKNLPLRQAITSFAGLRAHEDGHEFIVEEVSDAPGFFDCAGIESPGLSSSPAIGERMAGLIQKKLQLTPRADFIATRRGILNPQQLPFDQRQALIRENPAYGRVICRCETITEGEILDAIHRPLGARSLDGVKRRTRAGMGRCQGGFCAPRVMEILARELGQDLTEITKCGGASHIVVGPAKEGE